MPSPGNKIRELRKQRSSAFEQLAELTESSKSYIWELENKDDPPTICQEKTAKIAAVLEVTAEFLLSDSVTTLTRKSPTRAFFRKFKSYRNRTKENPQDPGRLGR